MRRIRYALALAAAASLGLVAAASAETPSIGAPAPEIKLTTLDGKPFTLSEAVRGKNAVVVIFIATICPYSNAYNDRMRDMAIAYGKQGILFVGINSNKSEPAEEVGAHGKQHGFAFPLMKDPTTRSPTSTMPGTRPKSSSWTAPGSCATTAVSTRTTKTPPGSPRRT